MEAISTTSDRRRRSCGARPETRFRLDGLPPNVVPVMGDASPLAVALLQLPAAGLHTLQSPPRRRIALKIQKDESQQKIHRQQG